MDAASNGTRRRDIWRDNQPWTRRQQRNAMTDFQRKIDLQSVDDLQYLVSNIRRAAHDKINLDLPAVKGGGEDPLRTRVETLVAEYIHAVLEAAGPNIAINGLSLTPTRVRELLQQPLAATSIGAGEIEEYEAFDARLVERAQALARQEEDLIEEIATLRRSVPATVVAQTTATLRGDGDADEAAVRALVAQIETGERRRPVDLGIGALERQESVEQTWEAGVQKLGSVMRALPETMAKKERAQEAEAYVLKGETRQ
ncbi:hypothetical protein K3495_g3343 [Podosphaera aphanis]|nr:hypothetical protein K3495_g3343 [Podosphaera aphanis]